MIASELRIGNWVIHKNEGLLILSISDEGVNLDSGIAYGDPYIFPCYRIQDLEPIILTEELFVKFGFRLETFPFNTYVTKPCYLKSEGNIQISFRDGVYWFNYSGHLIKLKYVHQLQNFFFALTGTELEFKQD